MRVRKMEVFHPDSPGVRLTVRRGFWGRIFKSKEFSTLSEALSAHREKKGDVNMTSCKSVQHSDQVVCECGNVWDTNDPDPPHCNPPKKSEQEPVGWMYSYIGGTEVQTSMERWIGEDWKSYWEETPLYTTPQPEEHQPLTCQECGGDGAGGEHEDDCAMAQVETDEDVLVEALDLLKEAHDELVAIKAAIGFRVNTLALIERIESTLTAHR